MPRNPATSGRRKVHPELSREIIRHVTSPLSVFAHCESPAFLRQALEKANSSGQLPTKQMITIGAASQRSRDILAAIESEEHRKNAASVAAAHIRNARLLIEQAELVGDSVRPIIYYYGGLSFLDFITSCIVRRQRVGNPGHGLSVTCATEGWDFDRNWPRDKCFVEMGPSGDFPFYVDALTVGGWPSLFSGYRLQQETKTSSWETKINPAPLLKGPKVSLDYLCNFDFERHRADNPAVNEWLVGTDWKLVWKFTTLLLDFVVVYVASSLARYYIPAWHRITEAAKSPIYNDIKSAYTAVHDKLPYYFEDEDPFQYSVPDRSSSIHGIKVLL
jgi:hypothetical protein